MASPTCSCSSTAPCASSSSSHEVFRKVVAKLLHPLSIRGRTRGPAADGRRRGGILRAGRPAAALRRRRRRDHRGKASPQRRQADCLHGKDRERNAAGGVRRAERARRDEGAACTHRQQESARRRQRGDALLGARAWIVGRPLRPARAAENGESRQRRAPCARARRSRLHAQAHAEPGGLPVRSGGGPRSIALTGAKLRAPEIKPVPAKNKAKHLVKLTAPEGCGRFAGRVIRDVDPAAPTPQWMRARLESAGQRSISALVDVTNYVMLELGRPLHVYDLDKLRGPIDVRWGRKGEKVLLLNEQEVEVDASVLCITDDSGVIGLGGIMGGESTKADAATRNIFLESAFFYPEAMAGRARRYNFASDASHRFERGVDFANNVDGIERATRLILELCGGEPGPSVDKVARLSH